MDAPISLITRGDDAGSSRTANILDTFQNGILKNASVMVPCVAHAADLLKDHDDLCCGLHTTVTWDTLRWGPLLPTNEVPSLADTNGHFFKTTTALKEYGPNLKSDVALRTPAFWTIFKPTMWFPFGMQRPVSEYLLILILG